MGVDHPRRRRSRISDCSKANVPAEVPARLPVSTAESSGGSGELLTPASRQGQKTTACHYQARQTRAYDRTWYKRNIYRPGVASLTAEYVGNEDVAQIIRAGHVSNRRISNAEDEVAADPKSPVPAGGAADHETERPCAVTV